MLIKRNTSNQGMYFLLFEIPGKLLQQKSSKDSTREAKQLLQRALDICTAKLGVYHMTSKLVRRYLMSLETVDAAAKLSSKGSGRELKSLESAGIPDR